VLALHEHLADEAKVLEDQMELARIKKEELENAQQKVEELETTRLRIEREISRLHNRNNDADGEEAEALQEEEEQVTLVKNRYNAFNTIYLNGASFFILATQRAQPNLQSIGAGKDRGRARCIRACQHPIRN
jgi:hypothetical protein